MRDAQLEAVYDAVVEAARDEPRPEPIHNIPYDEFVTEWDQPDVDLDASTIAYDGQRRPPSPSSESSATGGNMGSPAPGATTAARGPATVVKRVALRAAAARGVTRVTTSNAEENAAMRAVNRNLGFTPIGEHVIYARDLS